LIIRANFDPEYSVRRRSRVVDFATHEGEKRHLAASRVEKLRCALALGIRDFVIKTGFEKVHLGSSGGIDSAVVTCLAVDALAGQRKDLCSPGPYSSDVSLSSLRS